MPTVPSTNVVEHADQATFGQKVLRAPMPVLVDFYADWCGPCKAMAPVLEEIAQDEPNVRIVKVNVDRNPELATRYRIEAIPSLLVFRNGQIRAQHAGLANKVYLKTLLTR